MDETAVTLFLAGDVMTGRGVDQILGHPSNPELHEPYVSDAREYVRLAEQVTGPLPRGVSSDYIWGDGLAEWKRMAPAARVVNLETSITRSDQHEPKGINYRMHPDNIGCLRAAAIDICIVANNHVLDYGPQGLVETLEALERAGIRSVGAGRNRDAAVRAVVHALPGGRHLIVGACAHDSSGVPDDWAALSQEPGINLLPDLSDDTATDVAGRVARDKLPGDVAAMSIHWGGNWGYDVPRQHISFAHRLVEGGIDIVYGHSSHHVRPIEIYRDRLILYGCGDFIDDYEGIAGHEEYRDDLVLMFFPSLSPQTGQLLTLEMTPLQIRRMRLNRASQADLRWICDRVNTVSRRFGTQMSPTEQGTLRLSDGRQ
ncbi:MAG: CapA family protein [Acidobacteria bacterium]|nr:MAG: CapA family protein [Acidobacteriota bacterium]